VRAPRRRRRLSITALFAACAVGIAAPTAVAACPEEGATGQPFAPWDDFGTYALASGGSFESLTWSGSGSPARAPENDPFMLAGSGLWSMRLRGQQAISSPVLCVSGEHPYLRFVVDRESRLVLEVLWTDEGVYKEKVLEEHPADHWQAWGPSKRVPLGGALPTDSGEEHQLRLRFKLKDGQGDWLVDDVFVDPVKRG
jgi:hypothetical protein